MDFSFHYSDNLLLQGVVVLVVAVLIVLGVQALLRGPSDRDDDAEG